MYIPEKKPLFRKDVKKTNPYIVAAMLGIIMVMLIVLRSLYQGELTPMYMPTPTPTRTLDSFAGEGEVYFGAGDLERSIEAYHQAVALDSGNAELQAELARILVYSSTLLTVDQERIERLEEALTTINNAVEIAPEDSMVHAIKSFTLDWLAGNSTTQSEKETLLNEAEQAAARAPELMDVRRINGYVQESLGNYNQAISEYKEAIHINPNLTFIYLRIGANYRKLKQYKAALEYFDKAAVINEQLGVRDSIPYFSIATTYTQMGEFFSAGLNARKGLNYDPDNADAYGRLGIVFHRSRNYEGAIPAFKCAIRGCTAEESCEVRQCDPETDTMVAVEGLPLTASTVDYYLTYGAVLAGMHRTSNGFCEEGMDILKMVKKDYRGDPIIMQNVVESETICSSYGYY
jgi:tetratricopeptide (TPR) repeat protein